jgi:imidazolonepropionase
MKLVMSLGCIRLKMLPEEVINAVTINSAYAMGLSETHGSIARGKVANLFITKEIPSYQFIPYAFGSDLIDTIILKGKVLPHKSPKWGVGGRLSKRPLSNPL